MTGDPTTHEWAADAAASPLDHVSSDQDRPAGADDRIDVLPRRPTTRAARGVEAAPVAHDALSGARNFDDTEFKGLAASVRQWLALTRAKDIAATTPPDRVDRVERLDVRATRDTVADPRWQDLEDAVGSERPALLIDADHVTSDQLPHLLETVRAAYGGRPIIRRAYADWTRPELASWFAPLRQHGVQPIHNFDTHEHRRSLAALTLEALDIVENSAVTCVVLVGDLGAALPLLTRLKAKGVKVAVIGPASNPDDVRRAVDDFLDIASLNETAATRARGRHRA